MSVVLYVVVCYPVMSGYVVRNIAVMIVVCINLTLIVLFVILLSEGD